MASTRFVAPTGKGAPAMKPVMKAPAAKPTIAKQPLGKAPPKVAAKAPLGVAKTPAAKPLAKVPTTAAPKPAVAKTVAKAPAKVPSTASPAQPAVAKVVAKPLAAKPAAPKPASAPVGVAKPKPAAPKTMVPPKSAAPKAPVVAKRAAPEVAVKMDKGYVLTGSHSAELKLFGAPERELAQMKKNITPGTVLFLFNSQTQKLMGTFVADSLPELNIVADTFGGKAPAQVRARPLEAAMLMEAKLPKRIFGGPKGAADVAKLREELAAGSEADAATQEAWGAGESDGAPPAKRARNGEAGEVEEVTEDGAMAVEEEAADAEMVAEDGAPAERGSEFFNALDELGEEAVEAEAAAADAEDPYAAEAVEEAAEEGAEAAEEGEVEEAAEEAPPATGVGATIHGIQPKADGSISVWGLVTREEPTCWRLESGKIAKKATEGVKWQWAPVEQAAEEVEEEPAAEEAPAEEAAEEAPAEEAVEEAIEVFTGVIYQVGAKTGNMLIKCDKAQDKFGQEAMIPAKLNPALAVVGNKIAFEVTEGKKPGGRPIAKNVKILSQNEDAIKKQIKYYFSDENLKKDRFFQAEIAKTEGGYISMAIILGCPAIKKIGCTMEEIFDALKDVEELELRDTEGEEGIRRTTPPPPLEEAPGMRFKEELTKIPDRDDTFYLGTVKPPFDQPCGSKKYFLVCHEVAQQFNGLDAFFWSEQKPASVEPGQRVVFTVHPDNKKGYSAQAAFVAPLQGPLPADMRADPRSDNQSQAGMKGGGGGGWGGGGGKGGGGWGGGWGKGYGKKGW